MHNVIAGLDYMYLRSVPNHFASSFSISADPWHNLCLCAIRVFCVCVCVCVCVWGGGGGGGGGGDFRKDTQLEHLV